MKLIITLFIFLASFSFNKTEAVYICNSPGAKVYHSTKDCNGLQKCKHEIKAISIADAQNMGRRACKICY